MAVTEPFDPASLFGADEGVAFDLGAAANLLQASGGAAVASANDPIGYATDLSGKGHNATQATVANKLLWRGPPKTLGTEALTNGRLAADSDWTKGTGWSITAPSATKTSGTASVLSQALTLVAGQTYQLSYTMTRTAGTLTPRFTGGTTVSATARAAGGTYTEILMAVTGNTTLEFSADASFAGTVKSITLKPVTAMSNMGGYLFGSPQRLDTASIGFSASDKMTVIVACQQDAAIASTSSLGVGNWATTNGTVAVGYATAPVGRLRGTAQNSETLASADEPAGAGAREYVDCHEFDLSQAAQADQITVTTAGVVRVGTNSGASAGGSNFSNSAVSLGIASFKGIIQRAIVIDRLLTADEKADAIAWCREGKVFAATIGDSTVAALSGTLPVAARVSSFAGGLVTGRFEQAVAGYKIANSLSDWNASAGKDALQVVMIQIGLNDVKGRVGENTATTADVIADMQSLIDTVRADVPATCRVYVCGLTPCKVWLNAATNPTAAYAAWLAVNEAIAGNGATPITGVDGRVTSHVAALNDGSDNLATIYDFNGDGVHESSEARFIVAQAWRTALEADGLL